MSLLAIIGFCALNLGLFAQNLSNSLDHTAQLGGVSSFKNAPAEIVLPRIYTDNMVLHTDSYGNACSFIPYFAWDNRKSGKMKVWIDLVESERKQSQHSNR